MTDVVPPNTIRIRTCNCTDFYLERGVIRSLLEQMYPKWRRVNERPCTHWQTVNFTPLSDLQPSDQEAK